MNSKPDRGESGAERSREARRWVPKPTAWRSLTPAAARYDTAVAAGDPSFPFAGYDEVLTTTVRLAAARSSLCVLDLGIGTGNLAVHFAAAGCQVWGLDFSAPMLAQARERLPQVHLIQADLLAEWPIAAGPLFDRIVTAYVLHESDLPDKLRLLEAAGRYLMPGGFIVVADIAFPTTAARAAAAVQWADLWDETEFYWAADEAIAAGAALDLSLGISRSPGALAC